MATAPAGAAPSPSAADLALIGPGSAFRHHASDPRVGLFLHRAALLQVAHPVVAAGVDDHSSVFTDPYGRALRTAQHGVALALGPDPAAAARRIRELHRPIGGRTPDGRPYHAWNREAWAFVHLTVAEAVLVGMKVVHPRIDAGELEEVYAGHRVVGRLYGVRDEDQPADVPALRAWFDDVLARRLVDNGTAQRVRAIVQHPPRPEALPIPPPLWSAVRPLTGLALGQVFEVLAGTLPSRHRRRLGFPWTPWHQVRWDAVVLAMRAADVVPRPRRPAPSGGLAA